MESRSLSRIALNLFPFSLNPLKRPSIFCQIFLCSHLLIASRGCGAEVLRFSFVGITMANKQCSLYFYNEVAIFFRDHLFSLTYYLVELLLLSIECSSDSSSTMAILLV